ncbi:hypothetical protein LJR290_005859 [Variovorax sp. LjRoot290]|uniref:hypothetical protein n=1 Tax=Variovorax sp. LjRoot130 TaxID=3342261 RepID=UPI003ED17407
MSFRAFAGPADFSTMIACANASFAAEQTEFFRTIRDVPTSSCQRATWASLTPVAISRLT